MRYRKKRYKKEGDLITQRNYKIKYVYIEKIEKRKFNQK